jgi:uncharacterized delta-60 repeat protein
MKRRSMKRRPALEPLEGRALLTAGALDTTFGGTGLVTTQVGNHSTGCAPPGLSTDVAVQPADLKTVAVGSAAQYYNGAWHTGLAVARYNTDGSLDATFGSGGLVYIHADSSAADTLVPRSYSVALQPDGKIVVAGDTVVTYGYVKSKGTTTPIQRDDILVVRLNPNGSLDSTFGNNGQSIVDFAIGNNASCGLAIQANGDIVVAGRVSGGPAQYPILVVRLTPSGSVDHTFGPNGQGFTGKTTGSAWSMALDASGDILIGGNDTNPATGVTTQAVLRYTPNGLPDSTFGSNGEVFLNSTTRGVSGIGFQSTGQIVVCGDMGSSTSSYYRTGIARLNANGSIDTSFGSGGYLYDTSMLNTGGLAVQPDDKIVVAGENFASVSTSTPEFQVDRVLAGGQSLDSTFGTGGQVLAAFPSATNEGRGVVAIGPDGKITYTGGAGTSTGWEFGVARLMGDPYATTTTLTSSLNPSNYSQSVTFTATVSAPWGTPTGTVEFWDDTTGTLLGTATLTTVNGVTTATSSTSVLSSGVHNIRALYDGDANDLGSTSGDLSQVVN